MSALLGHLPSRNLRIPCVTAMFVAGGTDSLPATQPACSVIVLRTDVLISDAYATRLECGSGHLPLRDDGSVNCRLTVTLPAPSARCEPSLGRTHVDDVVDADGVTHSVCEVAQLVPDRSGESAPAGSGWYYDDYSLALDRECGNGDPSDGVESTRLTFTEGAEPAVGSRVRLECLRVARHSSPDAGCI